MNIAPHRPTKKKATVVGVDGCSAGWFAVALKREGWEIAVHGDFQALWSAWQHADLILVDIPIGLPDRQTPVRQCDVESRKLLGPRRCSVFPAPSRAALNARSYDEACRLNKAEVGKSLSQQAFHILGKVRQVDTLLRREPAARAKVLEIHPELCFWALNGCRPMRYNKRKEEGSHERMGVLARVLPTSGQIVQEALARLPRKDVGRDDILDALAAAVVGNCCKLMSMPSEVPQDACGFPMQMVRPSSMDLPIWSGSTTRGCCPLRNLACYGRRFVLHESL